MVGTSGLYIPPPSFINGLRALCDLHEILLIFDETMTGWGRTGRWFAADHFDVTPDIMVTAKGITSGYIPFGCVVMTTPIYESFLDNPFVAGSTTEGHALGCAAGLANIDVYRKEELITRSEQMGKRMLDGLMALKQIHPSVGDVRGCGLFACIELTSDREARAPLAGYRDSRREVASLLLSRLLSLGVSTIAKWDFLFFAPPLIVEEAQVDDALEKLDDALKEADRLVH
jgi:taurine--2-oxoglutarate transaminase